MQIPVKRVLFYSISLIVLFSCTPEKSPFDVSPADSLDPKRVEQPYPSISIPEDADLESAVWKGIDLSPQPPVVPVSANEQLKSFILQPGYKLEPILSEPQIREPAAIQFDGNGRMYVLELRTYMQDIDANGELMPTSRISRWEDQDNDGVYETSVIFLDSLVFPRYVVPFGKNTILSMESNEDNVYKYTDTDDDGKADKKELFASGLGRSGNVEHQTSFLTWTMDNWMYSTYNSRRIRWTPDGVIQEPAGNPWGQWGVTQDNYGQTWFQDGAGGVPQSFQFPLVYGNFGVKGQYKDGFREPFSLVKLADFQPGMRETKPDGSLNNVTGSAGNDVFRGDRLPKEIQNKYFYGEPVGRIVRQVNVEKSEGLSYIQNPYREAQAEFIQSTDPLFRPVDMATAPDGTMYIVDMYRGIIQQGNWTQDGSYLRTKIQQYQMDDIAGNGRIWRLTYEGMERNKEKPAMLEETSSELVRHLSNANGWWRDKAQQLIILNQDKSVVKDLENLLNTSDNELARIHALWTLEGLNSLSVSLIRELFKDSSPQMRIQALRASESLYKYGDKSLAANYRKMIKDSSIDVAIQALLSAYVLNIEQVEALIKTSLQENQANGIQVVGTQLLERMAKEKELAATQFDPQELALFTKGKNIFDSYCSTCHGVKGLGTPTGGGELIAPAFSGSPRLMGHPEYAVKTLLHGLAGALDGKEYEGVMISMESNDDEYIASVVSYIRNDFGNSGSFVTPEFVAQLRKETEGKDGMYQFDELIEEIPKSLTLQDNWKITASSTALQGVGSTKDPSYAFSFKGWKTDGPQQSGMWFQIELPEERNLTELQFNAGEKEFPKNYNVSISNNGTNWTEVASGSGVKRINSIQWKSGENARFLRIETTQNGEESWAMKQLTLYAR
ncbi:DUF7133 domain-containing protein [Algoriphagus resistens]|uniref:DUF7133 domain-containing protein n=1 Tax=Algoriphagus resistens TaxID=1750590 RepID=UPI0007169A36|nr:discoidin domain-containing protein [Algoriphagus resistens]